VPATLFISDLHLSGERPAISERFFAFLRTQASRASALYILGDLFEYWIGDDELDAEAREPAGELDEAGLVGYGQERAAHAAPRGLGGH